MKLVVMLFLLVLMACQYDAIPDPAVLEGKWVEITSKTDTIEFTFLGDRDVMLLRRGKEMRSGTRVPKYKSGPYEYNLSTGKISLRWVASSRSSFDDYYFNQSATGIEIGNFYEPTSGQQRLMFKKLK